MKRKTEEMRRTWLVQRLEKPRLWYLDEKAVDNPFSFGGGLRNGGLSPEAMDLLRPIFSFDYMGAAEFEFGAVPAALQKIAKRAAKGDLVAFQFGIDLKDVKPHYTEPKGYKVEGHATIYGIAPQDWIPEVEKRVKGWVAEGFASNLKEPTLLDTVLRPSQREGDWTPTIRGWLELDNGFMFFTDEEMRNGVAGVLGVEVPK